METTSSPPLTPVGQRMMSPLDTSPSSASRDYYGMMRRRTSSFSSNHDRSPVSIRSNRHRFSNGSQYSDTLSPDSGGGLGGMGNLADELEDMDDFDDEGITEVDEEGIAGVDGARDSGIDVSYEKKKPTLARNFSRPLLQEGKPPDVQEKEEQEEKLSSDLEDLISSVARMASSTGTSSDDPLIPRTITQLQDLGNQSSLETGVQRLNTSTNSMTGHLTSQTKTLQNLSTTLYSPLTLFSAPLDPEILEQTLPLITALLENLPHPDPAPLHGLQKLSRDTDALAHTLSQLTDTLQMGRQTTNEAARHLRDSQKLVAVLRRERESADAGRDWLVRGGWHDRVKERWGERECGDVMRGFEEVCDGLRLQIVQAGGG